MRRGDIIFTSSIKWDYSWHRQQELMTKMAERGWRVLFVEPVVKEELAGHGLRQVAENIWTIAPPGLPYERCFGAVSRMNGKRAAEVVGRAAFSLGFGAYIAWFDRIHGCDAGAMMQGHFAVYDLIDEILAFGRIRNDRMLISLENKVLRGCDLLIASSRTLLERKLAQSGREGDSIFLPNGVDTARFRDVKRRGGDGRPCLGFTGDISSRRLDYELIREAAALRPDWRFVFCGPGTDSDRAALGADNIETPDPVPGDRVPEIIAGFDIGIMPYRSVSWKTDYIFPRKMCEYLAAGIPAVATPMKELDVFGEYVSQVTTAGELIREAERLLKMPPPPDELRSFAGRYDWDVLLEDLIKKLENVSG